MIRAALALPLFVSTLAFAANNYTWKAVDTDAFTADLPGEAKRSSSVDDSNGFAVTTVNYELGMHDDNVYFMLSTSEFPPDLMAASEPDVVLAGARDGLVESTKGELTVDEGVTIEQPGKAKKSFAGRRFEAKLPGDLVLLSRVFLVEHRLHQVMVVFHPKFDHRAEFERVVKSFKLKAAAAAAAPAKPMATKAAAPLPRAAGASAAMRCRRRPAATPLAATAPGAATALVSGSASAWA